MSTEDKTAIEVVRNLQANIRNTTIAMVGILLVAVLTAVFWGGGINNKVDTNIKNIDRLTETVDNYIKEQRDEAKTYVKREDIINFQTAWNETSMNWGHISYWAESQGYRPLTRSEKKTIQDAKIN